MIARVCNICNSTHCPEAQMDLTNGCCLCFNKQMVIENSQQITLCDGCIKYNNPYTRYQTPS